MHSTLDENHLHKSFWMQKTLFCHHRLLTEKNIAPTYALLRETIVNLFCLEFPLRNISCCCCCFFSLQLLNECFPPAVNSWLNDNSQTAAVGVDAMFVAVFYIQLPFFFSLSHTVSPQTTGLPSDSLPMYSKTRMPQQFRSQKRAPRGKQEVSSSLVRPRRLRSVVPLVEASVYRGSE